VVAYDLINIDPMLFFLSQSKMKKKTLDIKNLRFFFLEFFCQMEKLIFFFFEGIAIFITKS
jgi:hypothetical protein